MNALKQLLKGMDGESQKHPPSPLNSPKAQSSIRKYIDIIHGSPKPNSSEVENDAHNKRPDGLPFSIDTSDHISQRSTQALPLFAESNANLSSRRMEADLDIEEGTPGYLALKANADVNVTRVGKAARYLGFDDVKKAVMKLITINGQKRGKPPRVPDIDNEDASILLEVVNESVSGDEEDESIVYADLDSPISETDQLESHGKQSLVLLDTKGKKREVRIDRKTRRQIKKMERKKEKRNYVKGKVIDGTHELYALSIAMMLGLRYTIFLTNKQLLEDKQNGRFWLDSDEFMKVQKYIFRPDGSRGDTPPHQLRHTFKFKDYSPLPFAYLRRMFGVNEFEFHHSVCGNASYIEFISNAKSGQFFFYSSDGKYMIKTMTNAESKFLRRILPHYFRHCAQNPNTILTKFLGMYRVKLYHLRRNVKFVVMNSVFDTDRLLSSFYDLKGSRMGRNAKPGESVLKDNDMRNHLPNSRIALAPNVRERLKVQIQRDCTFLSSMKIMDYSMLIGIHYLPTKKAIAKNEAVSGLSFRNRDRNRLRKSSSLSRNSSEPHDNISQGRVQLQKKLSSGHVKRSSGSSAEAFFNIRSQSGTDRQMEFASREGIFDVLKVADDDGSFHELLSPTSQSVEKQFNVLASDISSVNSGSEFGVDDEEGSLLESRPFTNDEDWMKERVRVERRREIAIEQNYWPFHRHYELNGDRRLLPLNVTVSNYEQEPTSNVNNCDTNPTCLESLVNLFQCEDTNDQVKHRIELDDFVPPISNRKDGGLLMDISGVELPLKVSAGGKTMECDGKIFYLGIIDILQQFNGRKRLEARFRGLQGRSKDASCVHPEVYAERFVNFFDEYTLGKVSGNDSSI